LWTSVDDEVIEEPPHLLVDVPGRLVAAKLVGELPKRLAATLFQAFHVPLCKFGGIEEDARVVHLLCAALVTTDTAFGGDVDTAIRKTPFSLCRPVS
jgi:hypothetical protein